jgi:hypothetical protein
MSPLVYLRQKGLLELIWANVEIVCQVFATFQMVKALINFYHFELLQHNEQVARVNNLS